MPLGTEVDPRAGRIVLDGFRALRERRTASPSFRPMSVVATVTHVRLRSALVSSSHAQLETARPIFMLYCSNDVVPPKDGLWG